ncbi:MAG: hypothetical protein KatS3mg096_065 [Candidatus Parcubacteria bacterium]|nr:MAG: hypothetical protein KatS3mg096_065 [Candidatus Parcubacteria bacterium]
MKKIFFLIIITSLLTIKNFALAKDNIYISFKKTAAGLVIGNEIFDHQTKKFLNPTEYIYEWTIPALGINKQITYSNIIFIPLEGKISNISNIFLNLKVTKKFSDRVFYFNELKVSLLKPKVVIGLKRNNILIPLISKLKPDDILTLTTEGFSSTNLNYIWTFNEAFISNEKEISVSNLEEKNGIIKIKVFAPLTGEKAEDSAPIQIE